MAKTHKAMALDFLSKVLLDPGSKTAVKLRCAELILRSAHGWSTAAVISKSKLVPELPKEPKSEPGFQNEEALGAVLRKLDSQ